ncbi:MAG: HAMP domain-containing protein [Candidatus Electrothrix sp. GM3_4]|nr:HAMP domain-containing protein [Candidatus Electrothrix sp. GM3_4]
MSTLLQAANDVSLKKKAQLFFVLNFLLTMIAAAGLLYLFVKHSGETPRIIHASLCVTLLFLLSFQIAAMIYCKSNIIRPLTEMQAASKLMAEGHLETLNYIKRADEIGSLGENINDLAVNMQEVLLFVWNHSRLSRDLLENISNDLNFPLDTEEPGFKIENGIQEDISKMYRNNEDLKSIVMSFSYFEIKLEDEKMVSDYQQESGVTAS